MENLLEPALDHIKKLLQDNTIPPLSEELSKIPQLRQIHDEFRIIWDTLSHLSTRRNEDLQSLIHILRREIEHQNNEMETLQKNESRFKYLANHDCLTGAMNRRSFMERAVQELNDAFRHRFSCGVIMMDVDFFKNFNDTYGHQAGDEALRHIVNIIGTVCRKHDFLGRYGGEEFVFFFCHADKNTSVVIAERIRNALQRNPVRLPADSVSITVSMGIAMAVKPKKLDYDKLNDYLDLLIRNADSAMYKAKNEGRNRVVLYENDVLTPNLHTPYPLIK